MNNPNALQIDTNSFFKPALYGKDEANDIFFNAIYNFNPRKQLILYINGEIGVGKSFFVKHVQNQLNNYNILSGKYEKYKVGTPFYGVKQIFQAIIDEIQALPMNELNSWKKMLDESFSANYSELISIFPEFDKIISNIEPPKQINSSPILLSNRINQTLLKFINFYTERQNKTTVISIENIQWLDPDSIIFIKNIISKGYKNLIFIFTERTNPKIPIGLINKLGILDDKIVDIPITPLNFVEMSALLDKMFPEKIKQLDQFKNFCYTHSHGNIDILETILTRLNSSNTLYFDVISNQWIIDLEKIEDVDLIWDNSFDSLYNHLDDEYKSILQISSCFGANLNTAFISRVGEIPIKDINRCFQKALDMGIIKPTFIADKFISHSEGVQLGFDSPSFIRGKEGHLLITNFEFFNDIIQEKIRLSFAPEQRRQTHKKIAEYYIESSLLGLKERDIFDATFHVNKSVFEGSTIKEKLDHADLNLKAAILTKKSASNNTGLSYIKECIKYNMHTDWKGNYLLASEIHIHGYEITKLTFQREISENLYKSALINCTKLDFNKLRLNKLIVEIQQSELNQATKTGLNILKSLGISITEKATKLTILREFLKTRFKMRKSTTASILALPKIKDQNTILAQEVIFWMFRSAQYTNPELNGVLALKSLQLTLDMGTNGNSYSGFMAYGVIIGAGTNNFDLAYSNCHIGNLLAEKYNNFSGGVQFGKAVYSAFKYSLRDTFNYYKNAKARSLKNGDFLAATEPCANESLTYFASGLQLDTVLKKIDENILFCDELNMLHFRDFQIVLKNKIEFFKEGNISDEHLKNIELILATTTYNFTNVISDVLDIQIMCFRKNWEEASVLAQQTLSKSHVLTGLHFFTEYNYYFALSLINQMPMMNGMNRYKAKNKVKSILRKMAKWSDSAPENHEHKVIFLTNLYEVKNGKPTLSTFSKIKECGENAYKLGFIQNAGLIYSILADLYEPLNDMDNYQKHKLKSEELYKEWGYQISN